MIPPYGLRHRTVPIARTWYSFRPRPRRPLKLGRPDRCGVCVDIERGLLGIRSGRGRMVTLLTNVAAVDLAGPGGRTPRAACDAPAGTATCAWGPDCGGGAGPVPPARTDDPRDRPGRPARRRGDRGSERSRTAGRAAARLPVERQQQAVAQQHELVQRVEPEGQRRHRTEDRQAAEGP